MISPIVWTHAEISSCGRYRYTLTRDFQDFGNGKRVLFVMLNPSTADGHSDDPTIRKCIGFARRWGFSGLMVGNLFGFRATDPREIVKPIAGLDLAGPDNQSHLMALMGKAALVVPAWGANAAEPHVLLRARAVDASLAMLREAGVPVKDLGLTRGGHPTHPLMIAYSRALEDWPGYQRAGLTGRLTLAGSGR